MLYPLSYLGVSCCCEPPVGIGPTALLLQVRSSTNELRRHSRTFDFATVTATTAGRARRFDAVCSMFRGDDRNRTGVISLEN